MLIARYALMPPKFLPIIKAARLRLEARNSSTEAAWLGGIWLLIGFVGSFGMNLFFHRLLFNYVPIFRSIRVPARWAMICFVGLALLAGLGAKFIVDKITIRRSWAFVCYALLIGLVMFEQRVAPLPLVAGAVDPDPTTLYLKRTHMRGGIVELPAGVGASNYLYTLRAADHERPLVNGVSGFNPPIIEAVEELAQRTVVSTRFLDLLEAIPVSYLVVRSSAFQEPNSNGLREFLRSSEAAGRLRLVWQFGEEHSKDRVFAVTKTEPEAVAERPWDSKLDRLTE
jgi:hypothetical protein